MPKTQNIEQRQGVIYEIKSPSGKLYYGQCVGRLSKRINEHCSGASKCTALRSAIQKYGWDAMKLRVVWKGAAKMLNGMERKFIEESGSFGSAGYNLTPGGDAERGENVHLSERAAEAWQREDVRKKQHDARVQAWQDPVKRANWVAGMKAGRANPVHEASRAKTMAAKREAKLALLPPDQRETERRRLEKDRVRMAKKRGKVPVDWRTASSRSPPSAACTPQEVDESMIPSEYEEGDEPGGS